MPEGMYVITERQYTLLTDMFHNWNDLFWTLPGPVIDAFLSRLYAK